MSQEAWRKTCEKVATMSNGDLRRVWDALRDYDPSEYYDAEHEITMDNWAHLISNEMSSRGMLGM